MSVKSAQKPVGSQGFTRTPSVIGGYSLADLPSYTPPPARSEVAEHIAEGSVNRFITVSNPRHRGGRATPS